MAAFAVSVVTSRSAYSARPAGRSPGSVDRPPGGYQKSSTVVTSNRDPSEWIALMSDPLLAQSAIDRLVATSYELVIEGESYRRHQRPGHTRQPGATGVS